MLVTIVVLPLGVLLIFVYFFLVTGTHAFSVRLRSFQFLFCYLRVIVLIGVTLDPSIIIDMTPFRVIIRVISNVHSVKV